jgi:hypothetical protein
MDDFPISQRPGQPSRQVTHIPLNGQLLSPVRSFVSVAALALIPLLKFISLPPFFSTMDNKKTPPKEGKTTLLIEDVIALTTAVVIYNAVSNSRIISLHVIISNY